MATITNKSTQTLVVHSLGLLEPGDNEISKAQADKFERLTGKKLADLKSLTLEVKPTKAKKEDS